MHSPFLRLCGGGAGGRAEIRHAGPGEGIRRGAARAEGFHGTLFGQETDGEEDTGIGPWLSRMQEADRER